MSLVHRPYGASLRHAAGEVCGHIPDVRNVACSPLSGRSERQRIVPALSLASDREMTIRWIWLVPSKICMTLASRM